jgi:alpha-L-fucosidase
VTPPSPAPPTSSTTNPAPGDAVTLTGGGFAASTTLTVTLRSDPVVLASTTTDATGSYSVTVTIPLDTPPGVHQLVVSGLDPNGQEVSTSVDITVSAAAAGPVAADGANLQPAFTG